MYHCLAGDTGKCADFFVRPHKTFGGSRAEVYFKYVFIFIPLPIVSRPIPFTRFISSKTAPCRTSPPRPPPVYLTSLFFPFFYEKVKNATATSSLRWQDGAGVESIHFFFMLLFFRSACRPKRIEISIRSALP